MAAFPSDSQQPNNKVIWLVNDDHSTPYEHRFDGVCECLLCKQKPRLIVLS